MCRKAAERKKAFVLPLQTQGQFLVNLGILQRVENLLDNEHLSDEDANHLVDSMKKLILPEEMGKKFKVLGITSSELKDKIIGFHEST
jgi:SAM-dependent MidA family methyltransferase